MSVKLINCYMELPRRGAVVVNIMRPNLLGNPFVVGRDGTRDQVCQKYRQWIRDKIRNDAVIKNIVWQLAAADEYGVDVDLVCCCLPKRCHGQEILSIIYEINDVPF